MAHGFLSILGRPPQSAVILCKASQISLVVVSSLRKCPRDLMILAQSRIDALDGIGRVDQPTISRRIAGGKEKVGITYFQARR